MPRGPRIQFPGGVYHVICRGNNRERIFRDDSDRGRYLRLLRDYRDRWNIVIHAYVLMPNHAHLLIETPARPLGEFMRGLNTAYTMGFNRRHGRVGHVFQGRYKSHLVEKDAYLLELTRYIHLNPVRAGLVDRPERYPWSSYREYIGGAGEPLVSSPATALAQLGASRSRAVRAYSAFVREAIRTGELRGNWTVLEGQFVGSEHFIETVEQLYLRRQARAAVARPPDLDEILPVLAKAFGLSSTASLTRSRQRARASFRNAAIYLAHVWTGIPISRIASVFGIHQPAASIALRKGETDMQRSRPIQRVVLEVAGKLGLALPGTRTTG